MTKKNNSIVLFHEKQVRRHWDDEKELWYFSVVAVVEALTGNIRPRKYWNDLKKKLTIEGSQLSEKIGQLKMESSDGKFYKTDVLDTENILRLIQSIPSPKAEPFKLWLAQVGYDTEIIIWIVKDVRNEHKQAIDWLDEHTNEKINFFAIKMKLWQIKNSLFAPKFQIISKNVY